MITVSYLCRLRVNCVGVFDVLTFDNSQTNHLALMPQYQVLPVVYGLLQITKYFGRVVCHSRWRVL